jgi:hypothetical protein
MFKAVNRSRSMKSLRLLGGRGRGQGASGSGHGNMQHDPSGVPGFPWVPGVPGVPVSAIKAPHDPDSPPASFIAEPGLVSDSQRVGAADPSTTQNGPGPSSLVSSLVATIPTTTTLDDDDEAGNRYAPRPLPQPPSSRPQAPETIMERPSTSAGPGSSSGRTMYSGFGSVGASSSSKAGSSTTLANKRMSRDDLYINTKASNSRSFRSYHIPIRGKPPSPNESPTTIPVRTQTPDSMDGSSRGRAPIGMALGSPGYAPPTTYAAGWHPQMGGSGFQFHLEDEPVSLKKGRKKGLFSIFGSKKEPKGKEREILPETMSTPLDLRPGTSAGKQSIQLDRSASEKRTPKFKPLVIRSQTEPALESPVEIKEQKTPKAGFLSRKSSTKSLRDAAHIKKSDISAPVPLPAMPAIPGFNFNLNGMPIPANDYLNVEIPSIKMDRYSVMFSNILQDEGLGPKNRNSQSNLLARRQATLDKLKMINDAIIREEEERLREREAKIKERQELLLMPQRPTTPPHIRSPSFSLFPTPPTNKVPLGPKHSPRARSNTSPANLPSPSKPSFERPAVNTRAKPAVPPERPTETLQPTARTDTPEMRTRSAMSQRSQDIPIVLEPGVYREIPKIRAAPAPVAPEPNKAAPLVVAHAVPEPFPAPVPVERPSRKPVQASAGNRPYRRERPGSRGRPTRDGRDSSQSREPTAREEATTQIAVAAPVTTVPPLTTQPPASRTPQPRKPVARPEPLREPQPAQAARPALESRPQVDEAPAGPRSRIPQPIQTNIAPAPLRLIPKAVRGPPSSAPPPAPIPTFAKRPETSQFGPEKSALILDSPTLDVDPATTNGAPAPMASISSAMNGDPPSSNGTALAASSNWPIVSSPPSSTTSSRKRSPSSASSVQTVQTHVTKPSIDEPDAVLKNAVEISIARQISLSQQQRKLLRPLETNVTAQPGSRRDASPGSSSNGGRSPMGKLGRNERLGEAKSGTATMVSRNGFEARAENRRSERIVLEGY